jgi:hypothetical protein
LELSKHWNNFVRLSSTAELGLLWPRSMGYAGAIIGMPFSLKGFAFFTEAIFLGIYLYGWKRVPPRAHLLAKAFTLPPHLTRRPVFFGARSA